MAKENLPKEKKSTAGAEGFGGGATGLGVLTDVSSNETFGLRFWSDGGRRNGLEDDDSEGAGVGAGVESSPSSSTSSTVVAYGLVKGLGG